MLEMFMISQTPLRINGEKILKNVSQKENRFVIYFSCQLGPRLKEFSSGG